MSMALMNDYYSFDKEFSVHCSRQQQQQSTNGSFTDGNDPGIVYNAVAYLMRDEGLSISAAKTALRSRILDFEAEFKRVRHAWLSSGIPGDDHRAERLRRLVDYVELTAGGSAYWHAKAPRYHVETRCDLEQLHDPLGLLTPTSASSSSGADEAGSCDPSGTSTSSTGPKTTSRSNGSSSSYSYRPDFLKAPLEGPVYQPFHYVASLPSKAVREQFATSLDMWLSVPQDKLVAIKAVISIFHSASLMCVSFLLALRRDPRPLFR